MRNRSEIYTPIGGPPDVARPSPQIFEAMGVENFYAMLSDFYVRLEASEVRHLFPEDMQKASKKIALFFIQLCGGPPLYQEMYGPPQMRARHLPFEIDQYARNVWLTNFKATLEGAEEKYQFPREHLPGFIHFLEAFSAWMVNKE